MADTVPMLSPDGQMGDIPHDRVPDAIKAGFKMGAELVAPNGKMGMVPMDRVHDAIKAGFRLQGAAPQTPQPDMQEHNVFEDPNTVGKPSQGIAPAGKLSGLPGVNPHEPGFREAVGDIGLAGTSLMALGSAGGAVKAIAGSTIGSQIARKGAQMLGAGPTTTDLAEVGGGLAGGMASQAELPNVGVKTKALAKTAAQDAFSHVPVIGRAVQRPSIGDYVSAARTQAAPTVTEGPAEWMGAADAMKLKRSDPQAFFLRQQQIAKYGLLDKPNNAPVMTGETTNRNPLPPAPNDQITASAKVLQTKAQPKPPTDPAVLAKQAEALRGTTNDTVSQALPDASKGQQMRTQAEVDFYLRKGNVDAAQAALNKATGKKSDFPPPAPTPSRSTNDIRDMQPEAQRRRFQDTRDDSGVSQEMNWNLQQHGYLAESEARKEFIARNSTGTTKGDLVKAAGGTVPDQPVKYTKNVIPKSQPPAGTTVPQTSEEMTQALQQSAEQANSVKSATVPTKGSIATVRVGGREYPNTRIEGISKDGSKYLVDVFGLKYVDAANIVEFKEPYRKVAPQIASNDPRIELLRRQLGEISDNNKRNPPVPQTSEDMTAALQKSVESVKANKYADPFREAAAKNESQIAPYKGKVIQDGGAKWELSGVNDAGILYWNKVGQKKQFTIGNYHMNDLPKLFGGVQ